MRHHVHLQIARVAESLVALIAGVRPFPRVHTRVILEIDHAAEFLAAHVADGLLSWFLARVDPHVVLKCTGVSTAFAAGLADVWPLARVGQHVMLQGAPVTASFATRLAGEKLFSGVFARVTETEAEHLAVFLLCVGNSVSGQRCGREEGLAAHFADKISVS